MKSERRGIFAPFIKVRTYGNLFPELTIRHRHGKEEEILFKALSEKNLSRTDAIIMNELIQEHKTGRAVVDNIVAALEGLRPA